VIECYLEVQSPTARRAAGTTKLQAVGASTDILDVVTCSGHLCRGVLWNCRLGIEEEADGRWAS
jgi:hypothetical protein